MVVLALYTWLSSRMEMAASMWELVPGEVHKRELEVDRILQLEVSIWELEVCMR